MHAGNSLRNIHDRPHRNRRPDRQGERPGQDGDGPHPVARFVRSRNWPVDGRRSEFVTLHVVYRVPQSDRRGRIVLRFAKWLRSLIIRYPRRLTPQSLRGAQKAGVGSSPRGLPPIGGTETSDQRPAMIVDGIGGDFQRAPDLFRIQSLQDQFGDLSLAGRERIIDHH